MKKYFGQTIKVLALTSAAIFSACQGEEAPEKRNTSTGKQPILLSGDSPACGKYRFQVGEDALNEIAVDEQSHIEVRAAASPSAPVIGHLANASRVAIKNIDTSEPHAVEIFPNDALTCLNPGCEREALYVDEFFLEPVNYYARCQQSIDDEQANGQGTSESEEAAEFSLDESLVYSEGDAMARYSAHPQTKAMISYGIRNATRSKGLCLRGVKKSMTYGGKYFSEYPGVAWAVKFSPELRRIKFTDIYAQSSYRQQIKTSMTKVPVGCVVIYQAIDINADKNAKYGHIEIRTKDGFVSDYFSNNPRTGSWSRSAGRNRQVQNVFCKI